MSMASIGIGLATTAIGGALGGGGSAATPATQSTSPFTTSGGMFDPSFQDGDINFGMSPEQLALGQQGLAGAQQFGNLVQQGSGQTDALSQSFLGGLNPNAFDAQQQLFNQQNQMLMPLQEQARLGQENRLFAQGRLGSGGSQSGSAQQEALFRAQAAQTQGLFANSFGQAQAQQAQQARLGQQLGMFGGMRAGLFGQVQNQQLQIPLSLQQGANAALGAATSPASGGIGGTAASAGDPYGAGLQATGADLFTSGINSLFSGGSVSPNMSSTPYTDNQGYGVG